MLINEIINEANSLDISTKAAGYIVRVNIEGPSMSIKERDELRKEIFLFILTHGDALNKQLLSQLENAIKRLEEVS